MDRLEKAEDLLYEAWAIIANVGTKRVGSWVEEDPEWISAAENWRDKWHEFISS